MSECPRVFEPSLSSSSDSSCTSCRTRISWTLCAKCLGSKHLSPNSPSEHCSNTHHAPRHVHVSSFCRTLKPWQVINDIVNKRRGLSGQQVIIRMYGCRASIQIVHAQIFLAQASCSRQNVNVPFVRPSMRMLQPKPLTAFRRPYARPVTVLKMGNCYRT